MENDVNEEAIDNSDNINYLQRKQRRKPCLKKNTVLYAVEKK